MSTTAGHATKIGRWWLALRETPGIGAVALGHTAGDALAWARVHRPDLFAGVLELGEIEPRLIDESEDAPVPPRPPVPAVSSKGRRGSKSRRHANVIDFRAAARRIARAPRGTA